MVKFARFLFISMSLSLGIGISYASEPQDQYIIEETPGKKKLHVQELDVQPQTTLAELLELFPELLAREGNSRLEKYDIQINGISTAGSGENILSLLIADDIDRIEVSESPSMTQQVNGQGAVIDVVLKALPEGFSGNVALKAQSLLRFKPSASFNYRKGALSVRSSLLMDYYRPVFDEISYDNYYQLNTSIEDFDPGKLTPLSHKEDTVGKHSGYQLARVQIDYNPDSGHSLKSWIWERYSREYTQDHLFNYTPMMTQEDATLMTGRFSLNAGAEYKRTYEKSVLTTKLSYAHNPGEDHYVDKYYPGIATMSIDNYTKGHSVSGFTKWCYKFISGPAPDKLEITPGVNYEYSFDDTDYYEKDSWEEKDSHVTFNSAKLYLSPYIESTYNFSAFQLNSAIRYQFVNTSARVVGQQQHNQNNSDLTAFIKFGWQLCPHHFINMVVERTNQRPSAKQIYPIKVYNPYIRSYVQGNKNLRPRSTHNVSLNYITDYENAGHTLVASTSLQYLKVSDIICTVYSSDCQSFVNDGKNDILSANAMLYYHYGVLSVNLDGNIYQNWSCIQGKDDNYFHYNISLTPSVTLPRGWRMAPKLVYNSHILTNLTRLGDYFYTQFKLSKTWGAWTAYAEFQDIFHKEVMDWKLEGEKIHSTKYDLRTPNIAIGFILKI